MLPSKTTNRDGLTIITGDSVSINYFIQAMESAQPGAMLDTQLARALKAHTVIGLPEACAAERQRLGLSRLPPEDISILSYEEQIEAWLARGEVGRSSELMALRLLGRPHEQLSGAIPQDASDFERCRLLLEWAPAARAKLNELESISPQWAALISKWGYLEGMLKAGDLGALTAELRLLREHPPRDIVEDFL